ncbi:MAG: hypothetical protein KIT10_05040 [Flavobacteriales bacterium]|nr:hypothetical protein [Flavobacteriales bacterium]
MARIFRNMRSGLLTEGRFTRYLIYAIGEILLVVIGILIALGINNANEVRKLRAFEVKMLHEVRNGLMRDTLLIQGLQTRLHVVDTSTRVLLDHAEGRPGARPTIDHVNGMLTGVLLHFHTGPYEAIKAAGLDRISNDELRTALMDVYDFSMPRALDMVHKESILFEDQRKALVGDMLEIVLVDNGPTPLQEHYEPRHEGLMDDPRLATLARYRRIEASRASFRLKLVDTGIQRLLERLDKELGREAGPAGR